MNMRVRQWLGIAAVGSVGFFVSVTASPAFTLIIAPARYSVIQVAQDILQRSDAVLVSYQGEPGKGDPVLHAWNGNEWVPVSMKDFREVNFLQRVPDRTILIGGPDVLPEVLVEASSWSPRVDRISDLKTSSIINEFGRILQWRSAEWKWFAQRYNLQLTDEAEPRRHSSWYDQPGPLPDRPRLLPTARPAPSSDAEPVPVVTVAPVSGSDDPVP